MEKVIGNAEYSVHITCSKCGAYFDVIEQDDNGVITEAMFHNTDESCTNMNIDVVCPECYHEMVLDRLEY